MENEKVNHKPRRAKGEGALYQNKDGRWVISLVVGYKLVERTNPDGSPRKPKRVARRKRVYCKSKKHAAETLRRLLVTHNPEFATELTLAEFLASWLEEGSHRWRVGTYKNYETWSRVHILPFLGAFKVCGITADDVRHWQRELEQHGVSTYTRMRAHKMLIAVFNQLVADRRVGWNPAKAVKTARPPKTHVHVPTPQELQRLISACPDEQTRAMVILAASTMLRIGEILALRLIDVDLINGRVSVTATLVPDWNGKLVRGEPKTESSRRVVTLPQVAIDAIGFHLIERRLRGYRKSEWLFSSSEGSPVDRHNFRDRIWLQILKNAGLPRMHFHALRHAGNSLLLDAGVPVLVVAARCGHADTRMTMDRYGHIIRAGADKEAAAVTDRIFAEILRPRSIKGSG